MTRQSRATGQRGEKIAEAVLKREGFRIEALNWRYGKLGEIDLIAYRAQDALLAFVEVKTRKSSQYGRPAEAVDERKQAQLAALAEIYLAEHPELAQGQIRFDVISIYYPGLGKPAEIEYLENAF